MKLMADDTHDPALTCWVDAANASDSDFPIQNLPLGVFGHGNEPPAKIGVAVGDSILDLGACTRAGLLPEVDVRVREACSEPTLNSLLALGRKGAQSLRLALSEALRADTESGRLA